MSCTSPLSVLHEILAPFGFNRSQVQLILQCESTGKQFYSSSHRVVSDRNRLIVSPLTAETCDFNIPLESFPGIKTSIIDADCCTIQHLSTHAYFDADKVNEGEATCSSYQTRRPFPSLWHEWQQTG